MSHCYMPLKISLLFPSKGKGRNKLLIFSSSILPFSDKSFWDLYNLSISLPSWVDISQVQKLFKVEDWSENWIAFKDHKTTQIGGGLSGTSSPMTSPAILAYGTRLPKQNKKKTIESKSCRNYWRSWCSKSCMYKYTCFNGCMYVFHTSYDYHREISLFLGLSLPIMLLSPNFSLWSEARCVG